MMTHLKLAWNGDNCWMLEAVMTTLFNLNSGDIVFLVPKKLDFYGLVNRVGQFIFSLRNYIFSLGKVGWKKSFDFTHVAIAASGDGVMDAVPKEDLAKHETGAIRYRDQASLAADYDLERCVVVRPSPDFHPVIEKEVLDAWQYYGAQYPSVGRFLQHVASRSKSLSAYRPKGAAGGTVYCSQLIAQIYCRAARRLQRANWRSQRMIVVGTDVQTVLFDVPEDIRPAIETLEQRLSGTTTVVPAVLLSLLQPPLFTQFQLTDLKFGQELEHYARPQLELLAHFGKSAIDAQAGLFSIEIQGYIGQASIVEAMLAATEAGEKVRMLWSEHGSRSAEPSVYDEWDQQLSTGMLMLPHVIATWLGDALRDLRAESSNLYLAGSKFDITVFIVRCLARAACVAMQGWSNRLEAYAAAIAAAADPNRTNRRRVLGTDWVTSEGDAIVRFSQAMASYLTAGGMCGLDQKLASVEPHLASAPDDDPLVKEILADLRSLVEDCRGLSRGLDKDVTSLAAVRDRDDLVAWARNYTSTHSFIAA